MAHRKRDRLENALRNYSTLSQGDIIAIHYNNKVYELLCMEVKPNGNGVSIVETDLEVQREEFLTLYASKVDFAALLVMWTLHALA